MSDRSGYTLTNDGSSNVEYVGNDSTTGSSNISSAVVASASTSVATNAITNTTNSSNDMVLSARTDRKSVV